MKKVFLDTNILMDFVENREKREWRHLDMWQCQTFIHASIPRYKDAGGRPQSVEVPWAESRNRITDLLNLFFCG